MLLYKIWYIYQCKKQPQKSISPSISEAKNNQLSKPLPKYPSPITPTKIKNIDSDVDHSHKTTSEIQSINRQRYNFSHQIYSLPRQRKLSLKVSRRWLLKTHRYLCYESTTVHHSQTRWNLKQNICRTRSSLHSIHH